MILAGTSRAGPGAGTTIAMDCVVKSPPDGYTLLMNAPPVAINMSLYKNLGFDTVRDLAAVSVFSSTPNVLTVRESGVDMIVNVTYSLHAPAATPRDIVNKLADTVIRAARSADTRQRLLDLGAEPVGYTPEEAIQWLREEVALWAVVVKASGAVVD